jgi:CUB/sushi domain-containing protein
LATGQWSGSEPVCQRLSLKCKALTASRIQNGYVIITPDNTAIYRCNEGYEVIGDIQRECQSNGMLTGAQPTCRPKSCKPLPHPKQGYRIGNGVIVGTRIEYTCLKGYQIIGNTYRECLASGQWSGTQPVCQSKI